MQTVPANYACYSYGGPSGFAFHNVRLAEARACPLKSVIAIAGTYGIALVHQESTHRPERDIPA
ncbi:hypothetical protein ACPOL_6524 [Acidisarcina polymorpha]|uniref:Uncharacterized protein n=1 Tax=Acidisarcina polymorpha TaxID=2211140 RepID=A0A2Z5GAK6_9BACT|nr:hypothetical protein ACPOL_6524 [Acidisarcina polymorpha]